MKPSILLNTSFFAETAISETLLLYLKTQFIPKCISAGLTLSSISKIRSNESETDNTVSYAVLLEAENQAQLNQIICSTIEPLLLYVRNCYGNKVLFFQTLMDKIDYE